MARVWGPLHSDWASGKFAMSLVYLNWKGAATCRMWKRPYNRLSTKQVAQRTIFKQAVVGWQGKSDEIKLAWDNYADKISTALNPLSGFNCFMSAYLFLGDFPTDPE